MKYSGITMEKITAINNINNINKIRALLFLKGFELCKKLTNILNIYFTLLHITLILADDKDMRNLMAVFSYTYRYLDKLCSHLQSTCGAFTPF